MNWGLHLFPGPIGSALHSVFCIYGTPETEMASRAGLEAISVGFANLCRAYPSKLALASPTRLPITEDQPYPQPYRLSHRQHTCARRPSEGRRAQLHPGYAPLGLSFLTSMNPLGGRFSHWHEPTAEAVFSPP